MKYKDLSNVLNDYYDFKKNNTMEDHFCSEELLKDKRFYKYIDLKEYVFEDLINQRIHISKVSSFNDCFDSYPKININSTRLFISKQYKLQITSNAIIKKVVADLLKKFSDNLYCSCFTDDNNNLLMWTHYANESKGICIEYDFLNSLDKYDTIPIPITYSDNRSSLSPSIFAPEKKNISHEERVEHDRELTHVYTVKAKCWEYENEYRIFVDQKEARDFYIYGAKVTAIYMGPRISKDAKDKLLKISKKIKCKLYEMKLSDSEFKYIPKPIYNC